MIADVEEVTRIQVTPAILDQLERDGMVYMVMDEDETQSVEIHLVDEVER